MAAPNRRGDRPLSARLRAEPQRFALLQAVALAEAERPEAQPVGSGFDSRQEAVRFRASLSRAFPASDVTGWRDGADGAPPELETAFLGLAGAFGPLPPPLAELALERARRGDTGIRDFLDLFNHRLIALFVRAKRAHRPTLQPGRPDATGFAGLLWALLGLRTPGLRRGLSRRGRSRLAGQERALLACAGLLNQRPVSAHALERLLAAALTLPVRVESFVGSWLRLDPDQRTELGWPGRNQTLGDGAVLGGRVWDQGAGIRVVLGPISLRRLHRLLPGAADHVTLCALLAYALGGSVAVEARLVLPPRQVPGSRLDTRSPAHQPRLGWTSFLTTTPRRQPGEVLLQLGRPGE